MHQSRRDGVLIYDSDTRGRERDGSSQGALLTMNRHQRAPATRKEAPLTRPWRLDEKVTTRESRPQHSGSPLLQPAYCSRPRPMTYRTRANAPQILTAPARRKTAAIFARAAAYTQQRQFLAEGVAAAMRRRRARASHITGGAAATQTTIKKAPPTPQHPNFTASASTANSHAKPRRPSTPRRR